MKTLKNCFVLLMALLPGLPVFSGALVSPPKLPLHIVFSSKAYWDNASKSCIPREKGGCCHIWIEGMVPGSGEIAGDLVITAGNSLQFTFTRRKGMNNETSRPYLIGGQFVLDGPVTFEPEVLSRLGAERNLIIPAGTYPVAQNGDTITVTFK
jgi:hypothetical protein